MTKNYADLHLRFETANLQTLGFAVQKLAGFGYRFISSPVAADAKDDEIAKMKKLCGEAGLDFVSRVDLRPRSPDELTSQLRRVRRRFELVCVVCDNKEVARQAAKDRRVDLLCFPSLDYHKRFFDRAEAELASSNLAALEVDVKPLLALAGPLRARFLSTLRREIGVAQGFGVPIVLSSGASEARFLRMPKDMASLGYLFGLDEESAFKTVSANPAAIVLRNRSKLDVGFVAPGIRVLKEGKDC